LNAKHYLQTAGIEDPANEDNIIDEYLDNDNGKRIELLKLIVDEKKIVENALAFEEDGKNDDAVKEWEKIFGDDESGNNKQCLSSNGPVIVNSSPPKPWCNV